MTDPAEEALADGEPASEPQPGKEPIPETAPQPEASKQPGTPPEGGEADDADADKEDDAILTAADLAESIRVRRQIRQAGLDSLGGTWFAGDTKFSGPTSFGGHSAARDVNMNFYYRTAESDAVRAGPVDSELLRRIRLVHVPSGSYARAQQVLRKERLLVLRGADGSGRRTTALFMLNELAAGNVRAADADVARKPPEDARLLEGAGYLAESRMPYISYTQLTALSEELDRRQAYMVVTVPADTTVEAETFDRFFTDHQAPECREVIGSHLRQSPEHTGEAERLLAAGTALTCATMPGAAADLAAVLLSIVRDGRPPDDLESVCAAIRRQRARQLLRPDRREHPRERIHLLCRRAALVSIAVFTGLPYADAVAAAEMLATSFIAIEFPKHDDAGRELFTPWRQLLAAEPDITIEDLPSRRHGSGSTEQLRFRDPELHVAMLEEVWEQYIATRSPVLEWLGELATRSRDEAVRVRAAQVVGRLATRDFGHVCHRLLLDWADSISGRAREAAATALEAAAVNVAPQVWALLADWCAEGNQHRQQTAVLALGTTIGEGYPDRTLEELRQLALRGARKPGQLVGEAVRRSIAELVSGPHQVSVVHALRTWAEHPDPLLASLARRCVPPLAHMTDASGRPSLLVALATSSVPREDTAALFSAVLEKAATRQEAWTALEKLVTLAEPHPGLTDALGELLADLKRSSAAAADQMYFYLRLWTYRYPKLAA